MKSIWILFLTFVLLLVPASLLAQDAAPIALQYSGAASISYAVYKDGEPITSGAMDAAGQPMDTSTLYGIGSVSKVYTAAAVLKLCEQGLVTLDTPVKDVLPEFTMADPRYEQITMRMLLNHSSGLMFESMRDAFLFGTPNVPDADLLSELRTQRLIADPGAYSTYCNTGFMLAQLAVEALSGMPYADFLRASFPLEDTFVSSDAFDRARLAPCFLPANPQKPTAPDCTNIAGTGGLYATADSLAHFGSQLADGTLLTQASLDAMSADEYARGVWPENSDDDALAFGLGFDTVHLFPFNRSGIQALAKGGDTLLYHSALVVIPEYNLSAAVLTSGGVSTINQLLCVRLLIDELAKEGITVDETVQMPAAEPADMPADLMDYSGLYGMSMMVCDVQISADGTLTLTTGKAAGGIQQIFSYCNDGTFHDAANTAIVEFVTGEDGKTYLFQRGASVLPGLSSVCVANYGAQRLEPHTADAQALEAWQAREGRRYLLVNAHPASQVFAMGLPSTLVLLDDFAPGYLGTNQLTGPNEARAFMQAPGTLGRDAADITCATINGVEVMALSPIFASDSPVIQYGLDLPLDLDEALYADESIVQPFEGDMQVTIGEDGWAKYFSTGEEWAGKTLTVALPEGGSFAAYHADTTPMASSAAYGDTTSVLEAGGMILLAGPAGSTFDLRIQ